ncbi:related to NAD-dependent deacetylase sirtuin type 4 [Ustilago trichophora]|uniref:Related to NAD-dependent deacetylase sirtuin type 4 n=1 Tax=Ustilago trichophora TaxID=86804 RepID=A0A5C3E993_9BASI|nr:related to NAD-dependent deacetylase sirtuin type 4 [Ustilago trichophora]
MRISIPSIPEQATRATIEYSLENASNMIAEFLSAAKGKALIMTGAGVSVDSGIAPYRGENGHYTVHKTYRPIFYHEFIDPSEKGHLARQRYFSRSYLGFPPVRVAKPNKTHYSIAAIQRLGTCQSSSHRTLIICIMQQLPPPPLPPSTRLRQQQQLVDKPINPEFYDALTATSYLRGPRAVSLRPENTPTGENYPKGCGFEAPVPSFKTNSPAQPRMGPTATRDGRNREIPKTNPDGDVELHNVDYSTFHYPACPNCGGVLKPPSSSSANRSQTGCEITRIRW